LGVAAAQAGRSPSAPEPPPDRDTTIGAFQVRGCGRSCASSRSGTASDPNARMPTLERGCRRPLLPRIRTRQPERPAPHREGSSNSDRPYPTSDRRGSVRTGRIPRGCGARRGRGQTGPRGCAVRAHVEKSVAFRFYIVPPAPRSPWSTKTRKAEIASAWRRGRCAPLTHHGLVLDVSIRDDTIRLGQALKLAGLAGSGGEAPRADRRRCGSRQRRGRDPPRAPAAAWRRRRLGQRGGPHRLTRRHRGGAAVRRPCNARNPALGSRVAASTASASTAGSPSSRRTWPASAAALPPARSRLTKRRRQPSRSVKASVVAVCRRARRASRHETADPS
jgi:hypothetical protein